ncbi:hypothetical protein PR048_007138 [Dryococelus australis]|uniref:Integrase zinc-binding domain-containing protein n=1 Tax=Dryococelus australis TaxID=614101 RepID=A0ABQ9ICS9_9NEOP|nr:hypothetical protein PR048_007138 [Dryococelus australis]
MKGTQVFIPVLVHPEMFQRIHEGHMGIGKLCGPNISTEVKWIVENCQECIEHGIQRAKTLKTSQLPSRPWEVLGIYIMELKTEIVSSDPRLGSWR